ncbi:MAG: RIP metalloprotease RseP [Candidatus Eisenbacteria bacterium]
MIRSYLYAIVFNLGILIFIHELGHYLAARLSGVTVERFSMGFGPRLLKFTRGRTEYALSAIPFGGYVKMAGTEQPVEGDKTEFGPDTFLGKRLGIRALIVAAGPTTNLIWAFLVTVGVLLSAGLPTLGEPIVGEVEEGLPAAVAGLLPGDRILSVDGTDVSSWMEVVELAAAEDGDVRLAVERGRDSGEIVELTMSFAEDEETAAAGLGLTAYVPPIVGVVMSGGPADLAGMKAGDRIVSIDDVPVETWNELGGIIHESPDIELTIVWERDGEVMSASVVPEEGEEPVGTTDVRTVGMIGIMRSWETRRLGPGEAVTTALRLTGANLHMIVEFFIGLAKGQVSGSMVGGPIKVVQMASESARWGGSFFFGFMAVMSLNLFLINMLPLPILDGGHLLLMALEKVRRRGLTEKQLMVWQQVGLVFFASLMVFLLVRDTLSFG